MEENNICPLIIKLGILGDSRVGKTCICNTFMNIEFNDDIISSIGMDKIETKFVLKNGKEIKLIIWDTAGQETFRAIDLKSVKTAHGIILVFDFTNRESFKNIDNWIYDIKENLESGIAIVLFGNKIDFQKKDWEVTIEEVKKYANKNKFSFFETSAKENKGIKEGFSFIANEAYSIARKRSEEKNKTILKPGEKKNEKCVGNKKSK